MFCGDALFEKSSPVSDPEGSEADGGSLSVNSQAERFLADFAILLVTNR
jgi:hypothetical protein